MAGSGGTPTEPGPWQHELNAFVRAFSGTYLFGIPMLYTLETWEIGSSLRPGKLFLLLAIAFLVSFALAYFAGFRIEPPSLGSSLEQGLEAVAVSVVASAAVLLLLNRVGPADPLGAILGRIVVQVIPLSMGVAVANALFSRGRARGWERGEEVQPSRRPVERWKATLGDVAATVAGGALVGFSIAPTEEIQLLAAELTLGHQLALIALSPLITHMIVFSSEFDPERRLARSRSFFGEPVSETTMAYLVSLLISYAALFLFDRLDAGAPFAYVLAQTLVLGLPTAVGGAAGRLVA